MRIYFTRNVGLRHRARAVPIGLHKTPVAVSVSARQEVSAVQKLMGVREDEDGDDGEGKNGEQSRLHRRSRGNSANLFEWRSPRRTTTAHLRLDARS